MKRFLILLAVGLAAAEKLDLSYLPPPGSKYAGGSPGDIQAPFEFPKESYSTTLRPEAGLPNGITADDTRPVIGINRGVPEDVQTGTSQDNVPGAKNPFTYFQNSYRVPTTTTSYAFSQTTTFPPESFETTVAPFNVGSGFPTNEPLSDVQQQIPGFTGYPQNILPNAQDINLPGAVNNLANQYPSLIPTPGSIQEQNNPIPNLGYNQPNNGQIEDGNQFQKGQIYGQQIPSGNIQNSGIIQIPGQQNQNIPYSQGSVQSGNNNRGFVPSTLSPGGSVTNYPGFSDNQQGIGFPSTTLASEGYPSTSDPFNPIGQQNQQLPQNSQGQSSLGLYPSTSAPQDVINTQYGGDLDGIQDISSGKYQQNVPGRKLPGQNYRQPGIGNQSIDNNPNQFREEEGQNNQYPVSSIGNQGSIVDRQNIYRPGSTFAPTTPTSGIPTQPIYGTSTPGVYPTGASPTLDYSSNAPISSDITNSVNIPVQYRPRPERPQAEADRNAVIINYENVRTPDGYSYSYDTSNGIHADETGIVTDGVKAHGSYSYIGDDGKLYKVVYTADENGFQPHGDHLPTPPPIPEAIQRVIEQAARDRDAGISEDGSYDESKYGHKNYQTGFNKNKPSKGYINNGADIPALGGNKFNEEGKRKMGSKINNAPSTDGTSDYDDEAVEENKNVNDDGSYRPVNRRPVNKAENDLAQKRRKNMQQKGKRPIVESTTNNQGQTPGQVISQSSKDDSNRRQGSSSDVSKPKTTDKYDSEEYDEGSPQQFDDNNNTGISEESIRRNRPQKFPASTRRPQSGTKYQQSGDDSDGTQISENYDDGKQKLSGRPKGGKRPGNYKYNSDNISKNQPKIYGNSQKDQQEQLIGGQDISSTPSTVISGSTKHPTNRNRLTGSPVRESEQSQSVNINRNKLPSAPTRNGQKITTRPSFNERPNGIDTNRFVEVTNEEEGYQYYRPENNFQSEENKFPSRINDVSGADSTGKPQVEESGEITVKPFMTPNVPRRDEDVYDEDDDEYSSSRIRKPINRYRLNKKPTVDTPAVSDEENGPEYYDKQYEPDQETDGERKLSVSRGPGNKSKMGPTRRPSFTQDYQTTGPNFNQQYNKVTPGYINEGVNQKGQLRPGKKGNNRYPADSTYTTDNDYSSTTPMPSQGSRFENQPGRFLNKVSSTPQYGTTRPAVTGSRKEFYSTKAPGSPATSDYGYSSTTPMPSEEPGFENQPNRGTFSNKVSPIPQYTRKPVTGSKPDYYSTVAPGSTANTVQPSTRIPSGNQDLNKDISIIPSTTYRPYTRRPVIVDGFGRPIGSTAQPDQGFTGYGSETPSGPGFDETFGNRGTDFPTTVSGQIITGGPSYQATGYEKEERFKPDTTRFGTTEVTVPTDNYLGPYRGPSTDRIIGEDFSGPKQPQSFDPITGYHY